MNAIIKSNTHTQDKIAAILLPQKKNQLQTTGVILLAITLTLLLFLLPTL